MNEPVCSVYALSLGLLRVPAVSSRRGTDTDLTKGDALHSTKANSKPRQVLR